MMGGMSVPVSLFKSGSLLCISIASLIFLACVLFSLANILASLISTQCPGPDDVKYSQIADEGVEKTSKRLCLEI